MSESRLESWNITPTCRFNRGDGGAWDEAVARLREVYDAQVQRFGPAATLTLTISRAPAPGIPDRVYRACFAAALAAVPSPAGPQAPPTFEQLLRDPATLAWLREHGSPEIRRDIESLDQVTPPRVWINGDGTTSNPTPATAEVPRPLGPEKRTLTHLRAHLWDLKTAPQ